MSLDNVKMFPRSTPVEGDDGHLINEKNITRLMRVASGADSYVVSSDGSNIEFVLKGYYITMAKSNVTGKFVSATITADTQMLTDITFSNESGDLRLKDDTGNIVTATSYQILNCGSSTTVV